MKSTDLDEWWTCTVLLCFYMHCSMFSYKMTTVVTVSAVHAVPLICDKKLWKWWVLLPQCMMPDMLLYWGAVTARLLMLGTEHRRRGWGCGLGGGTLESYQSRMAGARSPAVA